MFDANFYKVVYKSEGELNLGTIPGIEVIKSYTDEGNHVVEFSLDDIEGLDHIVDFIRRNGGKLVSLFKIQPDLEDVFLQFIKRE